VCTELISEVDNGHWGMDIGCASYINGKGAALERQEDILHFEEKELGKYG